MDKRFALCYHATLHPIAKTNAPQTTSANITQRHLILDSKAV